MKRRGCSRSLARILISLSCIALCACHHPSARAGAEQPRLVEGVGAIHHRIATKSREAQKFFDQGLAMVYAFQFGQATASFQHAADLDPNAAMPYWGMALAYGPNYNNWVVNRDREAEGFDAIQTAVGLAAKAPDEERALVEALAHGFSDAPRADQSKLAHEYADAMREVYRRNPDDPDAAALFAASLMNLNPWHLWKLDGEPGPDTREIVDVLEQALRRWPEHTGLNHFYIHTMEASKEPGRALESAHRLETLAQAAGHLVHMPSHIYLRTGDYAAAVKSNQQAVAVDRTNRHEQTPPMGSMAYANHNQQYLAFAASMDGDFDTAMKAADAIRSHGHNDAMAVTATLVLQRFARWDEVLRASAPEAKSAALTFFWHYARGCAFAAKGRVKEAEEEQAAMEQAFSRLPQGRAFGSFFNDWSTLHTLTVDTLAARIAGASGDAKGSIAHWRHAVDVEDQMNFDELPDWYWPIRESLGAALLRSKQAAEAEQVFREDLRRTPRNPRSLFGLWKSLEAQQKMKEAARVRQDFESQWKGREQPRIEDF